MSSQDAAWLDRIGRDATSGRELFVVDVAGPERLPAQLRLPSEHFVCIIAWDANPDDTQGIAQVAQTLLETGAVYICIWGAHCQRVHDLFDEELLAREPPGTSPPITTTWHTVQSLADVVTFLLRTASPDELYDETCRSVLGLAIGSAAYAGELRSAFEAVKACADGAGSDS